MRETRTSGSVRGASGNGRPYRERFSAGFILGGNDRFLQVSAFPLRIERSGTQSATGCQSST
jgi:hypothetical protein